jgi:8-oxo-dGTP pyrophosphatase MutT (NUDIX family)
MGQYNFQYCQKIVVYSQDEQSVLLCKRKGEADFDGIFSFIGGKMETSDLSILDGLRREKDEEVGSDCKIKIYPDFSTNVLFRKKDGNFMILPHYFAIYESGLVSLGEEYSEFAWIGLDKVDAFEPKIPTIPSILEKFALVKDAIRKTKFVIV